MSQSRLLRVGIGVASLVVGVAMASVGAGPVMAAYPGGEGRIVFVNSGQIFTVNPDGSRLEKLRSGVNSAPRYSPDGKHIAYIHHSGGLDNLWIMDADGLNKVQLTTNGGISPRGGSWSPDGKFVAIGGPCVAPAALPSYCNSPNPFNLDYVNIASPYKITTARGCYDVGCTGDEGPFDVTGRVAWSANRTHISFPSDTFPSSPDHYLLDYNTTTRVVTAQAGVGGACCGFGFLEEPAFGPGSNKWAYDGARVDPGPIPPPHITVCSPYPLSSSNCGLFPAVEHDQKPAFSPTGAHLVFMNNASGSPYLFVTNQNGTGRHVLAPGTDPDWQPVPPPPA
jgi:hypothetical protein